MVCAQPGDANLVSVVDADDRLREDRPTYHSEVMVCAQPGNASWMLLHAGADRKTDRQS